MGAGDLEAQRRRAREAFTAGRFGEAIEQAMVVLAHAPDDVQMHQIVGTGCLVSGNRPKAIEHLRRASELPGANNAVFQNLASALALEGRQDEAIRVLDACVERFGADDTTLSAIVDQLGFAGRVDEAVARLDEALARYPSSPALAVSLSRLAPRIGRLEEALDRLGPHLDSPALHPQMRIVMRFAMASILDRLGRHREAFEHARVGNAMRGRRYDRRQMERLVEMTIAGWSRERIEELARHGHDSERAVFIVGMPRSGTSLVEQILDAHGQIHGGGELIRLQQMIYERFGGEVVRSDLVDPGQIATLGRDYDAYLESLAPAALRVTDKFVFHVFRLGLIASMLPKATMILCERDPLDTCVSCFMNDFGGKLEYTCDLGDLGHFYRQYAQVAAHWKRVLGDRIFSVVYEDLVGDIDAGARAIVDRVGLPFDEACLRYYESGRVTATASWDQVRRPVYTSSVGRHKHYGELLDPLRRALDGRDGRHDQLLY